MPGIDSKLMRAAIAVFETGSFSKAATVLRIGQSGITKQIAALEDALGFPVFSRGGRQITPTYSGEIFLAEAKLSIEYQERAIRLSRAAKQEAEVVLHIGKSPYTDPYLLTTLLSLRLPLTPSLRIVLSSRLAVDLTHDLLNGTLDLALITGMPDTARLTSVLVSDQSFFVTMLNDDPLALKEEVGSEDLQGNSCVLFERNVHPFLYDQLVRLARPASRPHCTLNHVMNAEEAAHFVRRGFGVAVLTQAGAWRIARQGLTIRSLNLETVRVQTRLTCRADSRSRTVRDFVRTFISLIEQKTPSKQMNLNLAS